MQYKFTDLIDIEKMQERMDQFFKITGFPSAILDPEENVLVAAGWTEICTKYHRSNPTMQKRCHESDAFIKSHLHDGEYVSYKCKNGLWDIAFPIVIEDRHLATYFFGQFFFEDEQPDIERFRKQSREAGINETDYLEALSKIPRIPRDKVQDIIAYFKTTAVMMAETSLKNLQLHDEIKKRRQTARKLVSSERKYRELVENVNSVILRRDADGRIKFMNSYGLRFFGFDEKSIIGKTVLDAMVPDAESTGRDLKEMILNITSNPEKFTFNQNENVLQDGQRVWIEWTNRPICDSKGNLKEILSTGVDVTELKRIEQSLAEKVSALELSEEKIKTENALRKSIIESPQDIVIFALDRDYRYTAFNRNHKNTMQAIWGVDIEIGMCMLDIILEPEDREKARKNFDRVLRGEQVKIIEEYGSEALQRSYYENNYNPIKDEKGEVIGLTVFLTNVTERELLEQERAKAVKLESIGVLAGGIAHDFNNILTAVIGNLSLASAYLDQNPQMADEVIIEAEQACLKAKGLTQQLLTFAKGGEPIKKVTAIKTLISNTASFALRGSNCRYELSIEDDLWPAEVDEDQINQVLSNILINAEQAMPDGGQIHINAENFTAERSDRLPLESGRHIKITIRDQGHGIPKNLIAKIFDPYFTTKQKGNGLGLATCYSIVKRHGGLITADSVQGEGSAFNIYLPASEEEVKSEKRMETNGQTVTGRILVLDDEAEVIGVAEKMLVLIGHSIETVTDGDEAVSLYKKALDNGKPFDAVILDLTIPGGMGGKEVIKILGSLDPNVRAIVSSGYSNDPVLANPEDYGFRGVIAKPYRLNELKTTLQKVLSQ